MFNVILRNIGDEESKKIIKKILRSAQNDKTNRQPLFKIQF